jgi:hypothetical protein
MGAEVMRVDEDLPAVTALLTDSLGTARSSPRDLDDAVLAYTATRADWVARTGVDVAPVLGEHVVAGLAEHHIVGAGVGRADADGQDT